jgi:prepilin-type N-terminal cleavage/methylation domain-containing protein
MNRPRRGVTLLELLVTLVVLGVLTSVTTLGVRRIQQPAADDPLAIIADSLRIAIAESRAITFAIESHGGVANATVYPDGSVVADTALHIDGLSGRPTDAH